LSEEQEGHEVHDADDVTVSRLHLSLWIIILLVAAPPPLHSRQQQSIIMSREMIEWNVLGNLDEHIFRS
jgi:hypothetical protein